MADEWLPLAGVALGALLGFVGSSLTDWRARRERRLTRWDEIRVRAYFEFAAAIKTEIRTCDRIASELGYRDGAPPLSPAEGLTRLVAEQDRRTTLVEQVLLIGSHPTAAAARRWQDCAVSLHEVLADPADGAAERYRAAFTEAGIARDRFYEAARGELDVRGGSTSLTD
ncbi:MAG: hypothetical protein ACRCYQ_14955 [Nocardioides sp.]